jgi:hypothetical protein
VVFFKCKNFGWGGAKFLDVVIFIQVWVRVMSSLGMQAQVVHHAKAILFSIIISFMVNSLFTIG